MKTTLLLALNASLAAAAALSQHTAEGVSSEHKSVLSKSVGDPFYAHAVEGYPVENSLALTSSFIYGHSHKSSKSVHMGQFEVDVLWLYILGALIVIGVVVGAIICCCSGEKPANKDGMDKQNQENNKAKEGN